MKSTQDSTILDYSTSTNFVSQYMPNIWNVINKLMQKFGEGVRECEFQLVLKQKTGLECIVVARLYKQDNIIE